MTSSRVGDWFAGVKGALRIAVIYSLIAVVGYVLRGDELRAQLHVGLVPVLAVYLVGACVSGSIVGLMLPIAQRSGLGAAVVGFIAMLPISAVVALLVVSPEDLHIVPVLAVVQAAIYGGLGGPYLRSQSLDE